jgi:hypothetical protein
MADNKQTLSLGRPGVDARATKLLLSGWSLLQSTEHRRLDQRAISQYFGLAETTFSNLTAGAIELKSRQT